jgi:hypothetical protein
MIEDMNSLQSVYRSGLSPSLIDIKNEKEIIKKLMRSLQRLDKLWDMTIKYEERQNENKRNNSRSGETSEVTVKYPEASPSISNNHNLLIATTTGTIPTTLPSNSLTVNDTLPEPTMIESFVYGNKEFSSSSSDVEFLTSEDYDSVNSISDPTYSEICIPSDMSNSASYSILPVPSFPSSFNDLVSVSYNLLAITQIFGSHTQFFNLIVCSLFNKNDLYNKFTAFIINCHRIFFWDPGIF